MRTVSETSRTALKCINIKIIAGPEEKQKGSKKMFEEIIVKNFPNMEKLTVTQVTESCIQDKAK